MLIYKEKLPNDTLNIRRISLPYNTAEEARKGVLHLDVQSGVPCLWYQADTGMETKEYLAIAVGTGHKLSDGLSRDDYIGTLLLQAGTLVLHYFLIEYQKDVG